MGIDIYMKWPDQTEEEREAQFQGFNATIGDTGYLREAYHGGPYATEILVPEAFAEEGLYDEDSDAWHNGAAIIPAATLRLRLPATLTAAIERQKRVYQAGEIVTTDLDNPFTFADIERAIWNMKHPPPEDAQERAAHYEAMKDARDALPMEQRKAEAREWWVTHGEDTWGGSEYSVTEGGLLSRRNPEATVDSPAVKAFSDFVDLAEAMEQKHGQIAVYASW